MSKADEIIVGFFIIDDLFGSFALMFECVGNPCKKSLGTFNMLLN